MSDFFGKNHLDFHEILPVNLLNHMSSSSGQSFQYARIIFHDSFWAHSCRQETNLAVTRWALPWNLFFFFSVSILKVCRLQNSCTFLCFCELRSVCLCPQRNSTSTSWGTSYRWTSTIWTQLWTSTRWHSSNTWPVAAKPPTSSPPASTWSAEPRERRVSFLLRIIR